MAEKRSKAGIIAWIAVALIIAALAAFCVWWFLSPWVYHRDMVITSFSAPDKNDLCACFDITVDDSVEFLKFKYSDNFRGTASHLLIKVKSSTQAKNILSNYSEEERAYHSFLFGITEKYALSGTYHHSDNFHIDASLFAGEDHVIIYFFADGFLSTETCDLMRGYTDRQIAASNYDEWQGM